MNASLAPGFLIASPPLGDPNFDRTVVLLALHGEDGALGFVVNRRAPMSLGELLDKEEARGLRSGCRSCRRLCPRLHLCRGLRVLVRAVVNRAFAESIVHPEMGSVQTPHRGVRFAHLVALLPPAVAACRGRWRRRRAEFALRS